MSMPGVGSAVNGADGTCAENVCGKAGVLEGEEHTGLVSSARPAARQHYGDASRELLPQPGRILRQSGAELLALGFEQVLRFQMDVDERSIPRFPPVSVDYRGTYLIVLP